jgi:hypothetical protein
MGIRLLGGSIYCILMAGSIWFSLGMPNHFEANLLRSVILRQKACDYILPVL